MGRQRIVTLAAVGAVLVGAVVTVLLVRSGDAGDRSRDTAAVTASPTPPIRVIQPGRPGESAEVTDSDNVRPPDVSTFNAVDTSFVQMMIVHHRQAIRMAELVPERAANPRLRSLAQRMVVTQKGEIGIFERWLRARRQPVEDPRHDHSTMPGMQTEAAIAELTAARGADFDRRFVQMMTAHHQGAQEMAGTVLRGGTDQQLSEIANEMAVEQGSEIRRMEQLGIG